MKFKFIENISNKVGGNENLLIISLIILIIILSIVFFAIGTTENILENMCSYDYPEDYLCSCESTKQFSMKYVNNMINTGNST